MSLQPLSAGKYESSIWKDVVDDATIVDMELLQKLFKMNPGAMRADAAKKKFVCGCVAIFTFCFPELNNTDPKHAC